MKQFRKNPSSSHQAFDLSDDHYSATQLRADRWSALQDVSQRLAQAAADGKDIKRLREQALELLHTLEPIEMFWAFPGHFVFERLTLLLNSDEFDDFARVSAAHRARHVERLLPSQKCSAHR